MMEIALSALQGVGIVGVMFAAAGLYILSLIRKAGKGTHNHSQREMDMVRQRRRG